MSCGRVRHLGCGGADEEPAAGSTFSGVGDLLGVRVGAGMVDGDDPVGEVRADAEAAVDLGKVFGPYAEGGRVLAEPVGLGKLVDGFPAGLGGDQRRLTGGPGHRAATPGVWPGGAGR